MSQLGGIDKSHWKELLRFVWGISNHEALVSGTDFLWPFVLMNRVGNFWGLLVQEIDELEGADIVASFNIVAYFFDGLSDHLLIVNMGLGIDLSCKYNSVVFGKSFDGAFWIWVLL